MAADKLRDRTAVVTGASRGIGAGIATALAGEGVRVALLARSEAKLRELSKSLKGSLVVPCDVTNLIGPFLFVRSFAGEMKKRGRGHFVTIGSIADRTIYTGNAAYSAAKFGIRAVHEVVRAELRGTGVRATLISPAATDTAIWDSVDLGDPADRSADKRPMLDPDDVVRAVLFALTQPDRVNIDELRLSHS
jgi:NADP-dependent 3-hydroxy acid dehydrogenase YdfG